MEKRKTPTAKRPVVRILIIWAIQTVALLIMSWLMDSVTLAYVSTALVVTAVIGLLNALLCLFLLKLVYFLAGFATDFLWSLLGPILRAGRALAWAALGAAPIENRWAGLRPGTFDGLPYIGRMPGLANAYAAAGHFRSGLHMSPGTAVVLRQLMLGDDPEIDLSPFRVGRG